MVKKFTQIWFVLLILPCVQYISGQETPFRFNQITSEQGLTSNFVMAVEQDSAGFMWFGTEQGLIRYDGYHFVHFKPEPGNRYALATAYVNALKTERQGNIWVATQNGISRYSPIKNRFENYFHNAGDTSAILNPDFSSLEIDEDGEIWASTSNGLLIFNPWKNTHRQFLYGSKDSSHLYRINKVLKTKNNHFWLGCFNGNLIEFDKQKGIIESFQLRKEDNSKGSTDFNTIYGICEDSAGKIWMALAHGLACLNPDTKEITYFQPYREFNSENHLSYDIIADDKDNIWLSTKYGLVKYEQVQKSFKNFAHNPYYPRSLSASELHGLKISRDNVLWIGTYQGGINYTNLNVSPFRNYIHIPGTKNTISQKNIFSIWEDKKEQLWFSSFDGVLVKVNRKNGHISDYNILPKHEEKFATSCACKIVEDHHGRLWIATWSVWLTMFDPETGRFEYFRKYNDNSNSLGFWSMRDMILDQKGNLWIASTDNGLDLLELDKYPNPSQQSVRFKHFTVSHKEGNKTIPAKSLQSLTMDGNMIWIGAFNGGLIKLDLKDTTFTHILSEKDNPNSPSDNTIFYIHKSRTEQHVLWLGTANGLDKYNTKTGIFNHFSTSNGLASNVIYGIMEDNSSNIWISTLSGLSKIHGRTGRIGNFYYSDGLQANEFNQRSCFMNPQTGEMFFGGINGVTSFFPDEVKLTEQNIKVIISNLKLFGNNVLPNNSVNGQRILTKEIYHTDTLFLKHFNNSLSLGFTALNYATPQEIKYKYKLEGLEPDWNTSDASNREANYSNLQHGTYLFKVIAGDRHNNWSRKEASLTIIIAPPFWKTWAFRIAVMLLLLTVIFIIITYRTRYLLRQKHQLERLVKSRTVELEKTNAELEERQKEISSQREELLVQKDHLEDINVKLEEQQEEINSQKEELQSQNNHLEEVNRHLEVMNKKLVKNQLEIEKKNHELDEHRNNLEGLVRDRTRELDHALQKAEESDRLKSAFLANMSHEIRTPLNGLTGFSSLIVDPAIAENEKETYARIISQCSGQLLNIVNDILDISQIEAGIISLNPEKTELISFLNDLQQFYLSQAKGRSLSIEFIDNNEDAKLYTEVDIKKLRQILDNLLSNALKFTNEGFVRFGFERKDNILQFFVQDSGIGISPEIQKVIFERFRQGEIKMDTKYGGNGLGLAISEKLVMLMGGRIWVESEAGKGSVFYFSIPFKPVSEEPKASADHKAVKLHEDFPSDGIILVVEDDDLNYSYLEVLIKRMGIKIIRASSGEDAVITCRQNQHIELVLMDVKLPVLNGWAATRAIKEFRPELPVIMQTAFAMPADRVKSFEAGCDDYISKPVDKLTLNAIISKYVNRDSESLSDL